MTLTRCSPSSLPPSSSPGRWRARPVRRRHGERHLHRSGPRRPACPGGPVLPRRLAGAEPAAGRAAARRIPRGRFRTRLPDAGQRLRLVGTAARGGRLRRRDAAHGWRPLPEPRDVRPGPRLRVPSSARSRGRRVVPLLRPHERPRRRDGPQHGRRLQPAGRRGRPHGERGRQPRRRGNQPVRDRRLRRDHGARPALRRRERLRHAAAGPPGSRCTTRWPRPGAP